MQQIRDVVAKEFEAVNRLIVNQLNSKVPLVENIGHYIVDAGGKRLRPILALLTAGANASDLTSGSTPNNTDHITLAAIVEFIHTATLLHDDVVDISALRRGRPTANAEWGNAPSVLVGDFLYSRAFQLLVSLENMPVMALFATATNTIAEGEVLQLTKAGDPDTTEEEYFQVIESKTAVLFAAATEGSAMLSGADKSEAAMWQQYGLNLGLAFQLIDDVLDYEGDAAELGKNVGDDLSEGKPTLPIIYLLKHGSEADKKLVRKAIIDKSSENIAQVINAVVRSGAIDYTRRCALDHSLEAAQAIQSVPDSKYKQALLRLTELAVTRRS